MWESAIVPPSTITSVPVTPEASSLARNAQAAARSSCVRKRRSSRGVKPVRMRSSISGETAISDHRRVNPPGD